MSLLAVPPDPRERDRSVPCHIEHSRCNKWTARSALARHRESHLRSTSIAAVPNKAQCMSGRSGASTQPRSCKTETKRKDHVSGGSPPRRAARRQGPKAVRLWAVGARHRRMGLFLLQQGEGRASKKKVAASSAVPEQMRADSGGSPTGTAPREPTQRHKSGRDWPASDSQGDGLGSGRLSLPFKATA